MSKQIIFTKDNLEQFLLTELLILKSYSKTNFIEGCADDISKEFCDFYKFDTSNTGYIKMYNFALCSMDYMNRLSAITSMYSTFEQFMKISLKFPKNNIALKEKIKKICEKYEYEIEENSYYEIFEKYRMINNSIKHGNFNKELEKKYPNLKNKKCNIQDSGTILDSSLNITDDDIRECCKGLCGFAKEMYNYFEDLGYLK